MKTKKLNLSNLKVESFTTSIKEVNVETIKGGDGGPGGWDSMCCSYLRGCIASFDPGCYTVYKSK